ncbi:SecDF P1 head subdomain-containing protein [Streptomyces typhae]|uniref:SecDF P1 head subdomain-containing protein n=1 Tax=Streptomyces typhae TaxID=2681492 RepID=UPI0031B6095D
MIFRLGTGRAAGAGRARRVRGAVAAGTALLALTACGGSSGNDGRSGDGSGGSASKAAGGATAGSSADRTSLTFRPAAGQSAAGLKSTADLMRHRATAMGLRDARVDVAGGAITVSAPGASREKLTGLGEQARLDFRPVRTQAPATAKAQCSAAEGPSAKPLTACATNGADVRYTLGPVAVPGTDVSTARSHLSKYGTGWVVDITFTAAGTRRFADLTAELVTQAPPANQLAMVLDGTVISAPSVSQKLTDGRVQISGDFTRAAAEELAAQLSAGALPMRLRVSG